MPDPTISEALAEAYASAPAARPLINTLSLWHPGLLVDGLPSEIYCYQGFDGDRQSSEGVPLKDFRLEPSSRYRGGEVVEFVAIPFDVVLPSAASQQLVKGQLVLDGVGREITDALLDAIAAGAPIEVTYRAYLGGLELAGPQNEPPLVFGLSNVSVTLVQARGDISTVNIGNRKFPGEVYRSARFPALR